jgi:hypothetical protein
MNPIGAKKKGTAHIFWWILPLLMLSAAGCGGGGGGAPATVNLTGTWDVNETILTAQGCNVVGDTASWSADVVQTGNDVTVTITSGENVGSVFHGTISGDQIDWQGSYSTGGGTTTVTGSDVTATNTSLSGTSTWEWSGEGETCSGTTRVTGSKS